MLRRSLSLEEKQRLFHTELVKCYIPYDQATRVSKILASGQPDEQLTPEDRQLVEDVCRTWMHHRRRSRQIANRLREALGEERITHKHTSAIYKETSTSD